MSLRLSEAISAEASCSAGVGFFIRVHPVFCRAPCSPEAAAAKLNLVEAEQQREKQGKMSLRSSEAISAQASCSEGVEFFMRVHPVFGRAPFSPDAAAAKLNLVEAEQQRRRSGGKMSCRPAEVISPRRVARRALDFSSTFIRHLAALLYLQRLLLPNKILWKQSSRDGEAGEDVVPSIRSHLRRGELLGRQALDSLYAFIRFLAAPLARQRLLLPN
jgi:hypothetical protein